MLALLVMFEPTNLIFWGMFILWIIGMIGNYTAGGHSKHWNAKLEKDQQEMWSYVDQFVTQEINSAKAKEQRITREALNWERERVIHLLKKHQVLVPVRSRFAPQSEFGMPIEQTQLGWQINKYLVPRDNDLKYFEGFDMKFTKVIKFDTITCY
jgi:hypothetical protein